MTKFLHFLSKNYVEKKKTSIVCAW